MTKKKSQISTFDQTDQTDQTDLILSNSMLMTPSPIWGRHGELAAKTKKDFSFFLGCIPERTWANFLCQWFLLLSNLVGTVGKPFMSSVVISLSAFNKQFFAVRVHL